MNTDAHRGAMLTVDETAALLRQHPQTVRRKIGRGEILAVQLGGPGSAIRVPRDELRGWLYALAREEER